MKAIKSLAVGVACLLLLSACGGTPAEEEAPDQTPEASQETTQTPEPTDSPAETQTALENLTEPPALTVTCGETSVEALKGGYSWTYPQEDGKLVGVNADSPHPMDADAKELTPALETSESAAQLTFDAQPDEITVSCWDAADWGDTAAASETVSVTDNQMELAQGDRVYQVTATWEGDGTSSQGTCSYSFSVHRAE